MGDSLPRVVADLSAARRTGRLRVWAGEVSRALYFKDGVLVQAESRLVEETLGAVLVDHGWVSRETLAGALERAGEEKRQLGEVLIMAGALSPAAIAEALTEQVRVRFRNCLRPADVVHLFEEGTAAPGHFPVRLEVPPLLLASVEAVFSVDRVLDVLALEPESRLVRSAVPLPPGIGPKELRMLKVLETPGDLEEVARRSELAYGPLLTRLLALWALRLLEIRPPAPAETPAPEVPSPDEPEAVPEPAPPASGGDRRRLLDRLGTLPRSGAPAPRPGAPPGRAGGGPEDEILRLWLRLPRLDHYALLGVARIGTGPSDVKIGYGGFLRRLRLERLPEDATPRLKEAAAALLDRAAEAYTVLSDPDRRARYDARLAAGDAEAPEPDPLLTAGVAALKAERLRLRGAFPEAVAILEEAARQVPKEPSLHLELGRTLLEWTLKGGERADRAARSLASAAELDPALDAPWVLLGRLARWRGEADHARRMYLKALAVNPASEAAAAGLRSLDRGADEGRAGLLDKILGRK